MRTCDTDIRLSCSRRQLLRLGAGAFLLTHGVDSRTFGQDAGAEAKEADKLPGRIFVYGVGRGIAQRTPLAVDPNDQTWVTLSNQIPLGVRISPDGVRFAAVSQAVGKLVVTTGGLDEEKPPVPLIEFPSGTARLFWTADSKRIVVGGSERPNSFATFVTWELAVDRSMKVKLSIPESEWVQDGSPDGLWFLTWSARPPWNEGGPGNPISRPIYLMRRDGTGERLLIEGAKGPKPTSIAGAPRFAPDGRTIMYQVLKYVDVDGQPRIAGASLWLIGVDGKDRRQIRDGGPERYPLSSCWSPDGRLIAVSTWEKPDDAGPAPVLIGQGKSSVEIMDLRGRMVRKIRLPEMPNYRILDWR